MTQIDELFEYKELNDEEKQRISKLKTIGGKMTVGGETKNFRLKLDADNDLYWLLGPNDMPTWRCASISYLAALNGKSYRRDNGRLEDAEENVPGEEEEYEDEEEKKQSIFPLSRKTTAVCVAILVAVLLTAVLGSYFVISGKESEGTYSASQEPAESTAVELLSDDIQIEIIQTSQNIHKGEAVSEESLSMVSVSSAEYNSMILSGLTPVKWSSVVSVEQMYANRFIPAGQYLAVNYLSTTDPTVGDPWLETAENSGIYRMFTISVADIEDNADPYFGARGTLILTVNGDISPALTAASSEITLDDEYMEEYGYYYDNEGVLRDAAGNEVITEAAGDTVEGLTIEVDKEDSLSISCITIADAVICDIYNADGQSVYSFWSPYFDMPEVERRSEFSSWCGDEAFLSVMSPESVSVMIKNTQYEVIAGYLDDATICFSPVGNAADGDVQATIVNGSQLISDLLDTLGSGIGADAGDTEDSQE